MRHTFNMRMMVR